MAQLLQSSAVTMTRPRKASHVAIRAVEHGGATGGAAAQRVFEPAREGAIEIKGAKDRFETNLNGLDTSFHIAVDGFEFSGVASAARSGKRPDSAVEPSHFEMGLRDARFTNVSDRPLITPSFQLRVAFGDEIPPYPAPGALQSLLRMRGAIMAPKGEQVASDSICTVGVFIVGASGQVSQQAMATSGVVSRPTARFEFERSLHRMPPNMLPVRRHESVHFRLVARLAPGEMLTLTHPDLSAPALPDVDAPSQSDCG